MCDCYAEPCKVCGKLLPIHLGDFDTDRWEIIALCSDHLNTFPALKRVIWTGEGLGDRIAICPLTKNAWEHRDVNHPNIGGTEPVATYNIRCKTCGRYHQTRVEAKHCAEEDEFGKLQWKKFMQELPEVE